MLLARAFLASGKGRMWGKGVVRFSSWEEEEAPPRSHGSGRSVLGCFHLSDCSGDRHAG